MNSDIQSFLRSAHILARLVEEILERGYLRHSAQSGITFDQINILKFLGRPGPNLVKDVAHFLNASCAAASKAVSRLTKKKLARVSRSGSDRRAALVEVTPKGRRMVEKYEQVKEERLASLLKDEDIGEVSRGLERAVTILIREREMAGNPCLGCGAYYSAHCIVRAQGQVCPCQRE